jgi:hypothetical protein
MPKLQHFNGAKVRYVFLAGGRKVVGDSANRLFKLSNAGAILQVSTIRELN